MPCGSLIRELCRLSRAINFENPAGIALDPGGAPGLVVSGRRVRRGIPQNDARLALSHIVDNAGLLHCLQRIGSGARSVPNTDHHRIGRQARIDVGAALKRVLVGCAG